jgi:hypothetical protein
VTRFGGLRRVLTPALILAAVLIVSVAVTTLWLVPQSQTPPEALRPAPASSTLPLTAESTTDDHSVALILTWAEAPAVVSPTTGLLTASACAPGVVLTSGTTPWAVDGAGLLALHTSAPLWRDLAVGSQGADVDALRQELARLGQPVELSGPFDWSLAEAYRAVAQTAGAAFSATGLSRANLVWLPDPEVVVSACPILVGGTVQAGATLAETAGQLAAARISQTDAGALPGPRVAVVDELVLPLTETGEVADSAQLPALAATATAAAQRADPSRSAAAVYRLAEPVTVYPLPPAAVKAVGQTDGCVLDPAGTAWPVEIAGSGLGRTFVRFPGADIPTAVQLAPTAEAACS